jgi:hypothetical protein
MARILTEHLQPSYFKSLILRMYDVLMTHSAVEDRRRRCVELEMDRPGY